MALALGAGALGAGCNSGDDDADSGGNAISAGDDGLGPTLFRNDFFTYVKQAKKADGSAYSDDDIKKLVYLPTDGVMKPKISSSLKGADRLAALDKAFNAIKPSDLFAAGDAAPFTEQANLEQVLAENPVHIIVVPGIFGEFIPRTPFEELFTADSIAKRDWAVKGAAVTDQRFNVKTLEQEDLPLHSDDPKNELIRVGSIDGKDASGAPKALVTVAYLRAGLGSLEDFGTLAEDNEVYLHRLDAYFKAIGEVPKNLYLMGYSRGTATGLDLLVRARRENKPWAKAIKGFLAHAGVIYGSQLADVQFDPGPASEPLAVLKKFVGEKDVEGELDSCEGATPQERAAASAPIELRTANTLTKYPAFIAQFLAAEARGLDLSDPQHKKELVAEGINTTLPNAARINAFAARVLGIPLPLEGIEPSELEGVVDLQAGPEAYCRNVESFKATARAILAGAQTLTTAARTAWWKDPQNALPADVRYFAITGTMGDVESNGKPWPLTTNPIAYDPRSVDFRSLRGNYYDLVAASHGNTLQDSQVPVQRGRFWPELHTGSTAFGAASPTIETYFMGTLGIHHWGLGFPRAFTSHDGLEANPFPRTLLVKTIATFVNQVDKAKR